MAHPLRQLDLNLLVLFETLIDTGNLTATARRLGITQSAASQALARLRDALGDPLFVRTRGGMAPTPRAKTLARSIGPGLSLIEQALGQVERFDPTSSERAFRLAFGNTHCELALLPRLVARALAEGPAVSLRSLPLNPTEAVAQLLRVELDLLFDYAAPDDGRLSHVLCMRDTTVVVARHNHPRIRGRVGVQQFFREQHVVLSVASEQRALVERFVQHRGRRRRVFAEVGHYASATEVVAQSDAIALVPQSLLASAPAGRLQILSSPLRVPSLPVFAIWHQAMQDDPGHIWLRGLLETSSGRTTPQ